MDRIKISIIMPVYNKEPYLIKSVESVMNQSFRDFELIVIDDGSTDGSLEVLKTLELKYENMILYSQTNQGVSKTRNRGIDLANGEFICFLDADDYYLNGYLEKMFSRIQGYNVVYCGNFNEKDNHLKRNIITFNQGDILVDYINNKTTPNTNSWLISLNLLKSNNIRFPENYKLGEDMFFFTKVLMNDSRVQCVPECLTVYSSTVASSLTSNIKHLVEEDLAWMEHLIEIFSERYSQTKHKRYLKAIKAVKGYRMPAAVIYKATLHENKIETQVLLRKYKYIIKSINFSNRLRSVKLLLVYFKLKYRM